MRLCSSWALAVLAAAIVNRGVVSDCDEPSHSMRGYTAGQSRVAAGITSVDFTMVSIEGSSDAGASTSGSSVAFPAATTPTPTIKFTKQPTATTEAPTEVPTIVTPTTMPAMTEPAVKIKSESASNSQSDDSSASASDTTQSTTATGAPTIVASTSSESSSSGTTSSSTEASDSAETTWSNADVDADTEDEDGGASIAQPGSDSSTFQSVASAECNEEEVDSIYTLYSNCRSAFDLCVSASDYQIFPYQGERPTQAQIQGMADSDACVAVFIVVIEANFSACTIGGMPLVSSVETLLKISVDLQQGVEDEAPSADVFQELLAWRYEVDLAKAAGVPYDGSSELYAEFETKLDTALEKTAIRVNEDLTVDVQLSNGTYEIFEDAIDLIITDASAADLVPGYVIASSDAGSSSLFHGSSSGATGVVIESSVAAVGCVPTLWSFVVAVVASVFVLAGWRG
ncbi:hypothetical protein PHYPSEUDO_006601 [Phytophthora pseudosyringae]|uniref:Elicitin n=1 Tax=Phytophthora pseudosyringae TaxID=221518 RepID=A0A8T1VI21_9STRA|nr:hypothetical protein PHYPSEUDO_006601 [Phytophthora pseudosyringae]